jgi:hypothetical protein
VNNSTIKGVTYVLHYIEYDSEPNIDDIGNKYFNLNLWEHLNRKLRFQQFIINYHMDLHELTQNSSSFYVL